MRKASYTKCVLYGPHFAKNQAKQKLLTNIYTHVKCTTQEKVKKDIYAVTLVTLGSENRGREIFLYVFTYCFNS